VHHLEIVASFLPSCSASYLPLRFFSTSTTLILFIAFRLIKIAFGAKILIFSETNLFFVWWVGAKANVLH
jgi:hypothetical protein